MWAKNKQSGFTIVELLIVIVVIGILAAITIVAYNGIQQRAQTAALQSDLEGAAKQLAMDQVTNSAYPATVAAANNGAGLKASPGTSYSYIVNNSITPVYYCLAETNTASSLTYFVNSTTNTPQVGGCSVTNLVTNPNMETDVSTYSPVGATASMSTDYAHSGLDSLKIIPSSTSIYTGVLFSCPGNSGSQYTMSAYVRTTASTVINFAADAYGVNTEPTINPGSWQRISVTGVYSGTGSCYFRAKYAGSATFYVDDVMVTQGPTLYNYADGSSPNWTWTGTPNASTSTGPPL